MPVKRVAKIAVSAASYAFDKPFDYLVPEGLDQAVVPGVRVVVPFGAGNRRCEGLVLDRREIIPEIDLKPVISVIDEAPLIDAAMLKLIFWMRERLFCTCYDVVKAVLPAGMGRRIEEIYLACDGADRPDKKPYSDIFDYISMNGPCGLSSLREEFPGSGLSARLKRLVESEIIRLDSNIEPLVRDKTVRVASLMVDKDDLPAVMDELKRSARQREVLSYLDQNGDTVVKDLIYFTGVSASVIYTLESKGLISIDEVETLRNPFLDMPDKLPDLTPIELNPEQQASFEGLAEMAGLRVASAALLKGVTGSGKTEVYIRLIDHVLESGRQVIMLVPEIALTPQILSRFFERYGKIVAVLHSALSAGERRDEWKRIKSGGARLVVGTRSAVFAPVENLGLIIIDEEQEDSYKSSNTPKYHAKDVAKFRCAQSGALLLMGSATPSFESYHAAMEGKYRLFTLSERYGGAVLPEVIISDMRRSLLKGQIKSIGQELMEEIGKNVQNGEQTILFLNRRGYNRTVVCMNCGEAIECPRCSVAMTYHAANGRLMCHYCGHSESLPRLCPVCHSRHLAREAPGTQKIEEELREAFPELPIIRMDADTTGAKNSHSKLLTAFAESSPSILVGTQMVAKGLDFEKVTLVGVLDADISLHVGSFRSAERTFSLLAQVIGRSGRGMKKGRALIQTLMPDHSVIVGAASQDYDGFYAGEIGMRQAMGYPPFSDLVSITLSGGGEDMVLKAAMRFRGLAERLREARYPEMKVSVLGPAPARILKLNNRFRYNFILLLDFNREQREYISALIKAFMKDKKNRGVGIGAGVNPTDI